LEEGIGMKRASAHASVPRNLCVVSGLIGSMAVSISVFATEVKIALSGDQERPPVATSGSGSGALVFGSDRSVAGSIVTKGVKGTAAHIEEGFPGKGGRVVIPLVKGNDNRWVVPARARLSDAQEASLLAGNLYVNVQSDAHKSGEVRGQIRP
jgi:hypothetical protein